jgi:hypothetical protein
MADISEQNIETNKLEDTLEGRVDKLILSRITPRACLRQETCYYLIHQTTIKSLSPGQARDYFNKVCEKYPDACKENLGEKN